MAVDEKTVVRVARLARLELAPDEAPAIAAELNAILGWVDQLRSVDTEGVAPMDRVMPIRRAWRDDVVTDGNCRDAVLLNAPAQSHGFFAVPKVVE